MIYYLRCFCSIKKYYATAHFQITWEYELHTKISVSILYRTKLSEHIWLKVRWPWYLIVAITIFPLLD